MINDLVNSKYYCFLDPSYRSGELIFGLRVAESVCHNYYPMCYDSRYKSFKPIVYSIEKTIIYTRVIIKTDTGFHVYNRDEKYKDGYYLTAFPGRGFVDIIKIKNNKTYNVELLRNGALVTCYPLGFFGTYYISKNPIYLIQSVEKI